MENLYFELKYPIYGRWGRKNIFRFVHNILTLSCKDFVKSGVQVAVDDRERNDDDRNRRTYYVMREDGIIMSVLTADTEGNIRYFTCEKYANHIDGTVRFNMSHSLARFAQMSSLSMRFGRLALMSLAISLVSLTLFTLSLSFGWDDFIINLTGILAVMFLVESIIYHLYVSYRIKRMMP